MPRLPPRQRSSARRWRPPPAPLRPTPPLRLPRRPLPPHPSKPRRRPAGTPRGRRGNGARGGGGARRGQVPGEGGGEARRSRKSERKGAPVGGPPPSPWGGGCSGGGGSAGCEASFCSRCEVWLGQGLQMGACSPQEKLGRWGLSRRLALQGLLRNSCEPCIII